MNKTELSLEVSSGTNLKVLRLFDTSIYKNEEEVSNYIIEVLPPNSSNWASFMVVPRFSLVLNSSNLKYKKVSSEAGLLELPDGIYEIKQSIKPNILTVQHYYYLSLNSLKYRYFQTLCNHFSDECKKETRSYVEETDMLTKIKQYIDAAEFTVNENHDKKTGIKYYNQAVDLLKQFENECGCR